MHLAPRFIRRFLGCALATKDLRRRLEASSTAARHATATSLA